MYNRLGTIPACDGQTDRRTDILPRHSPRYAYASRGKKSSKFVNFGKFLKLVKCAFSNFDLPCCVGDEITYQCYRGRPEWSAVTG